MRPPAEGRVLPWLTSHVPPLSFVCIWVPTGLIYNPCGAKRDLLSSASKRLLTECKDLNTGQRCATRVRDSLIKVIAFHKELSRFIAPMHPLSLFYYRSFRAWKKTWLDTVFRWAAVGFVTGSRPLRANMEQTPILYSEE